MTNSIPTDQSRSLTQVFLQKKLLSFLLIFLVGASVWITPKPSGVTEEAWHLLALFIATIVGVIAKPMPMGAVAIVALLFSTVTKTLTFEQAFSGFSNDIVWLVVMAFFIAKGFIITGLGNRIAYFFMSFFGKSTLGLGYGIVATDLLLSPAIASVTARTGGVIFPILKSISKAFQSEPFDPSSRKIGSFLIKVAFQGSAITSAMFLTAMAGNPLIAHVAKEMGIQLTWGKWALASLVPGLISLICIPFLIYKIYPPEIKKTPDAYAFAKKKIKEMGNLKKEEWCMVFAFVMLLTLWIGGSFLGIKATVAALMGLGFLLLSGVLQWNDILEEKNAWDILFWFSTLVTMASFLNKFGMTSYFSNFIVNHVTGFNWVWAFAILSLLYFYSHYFFASNVAHIGAMYAPFLLVSVAVGTPPDLAALILAFFSSLFGGISHYGSGPAPILYGSGFVSIGNWWKIGGIVSVVNIFIWIVFGGMWWKFLGLW